ncbi:hypothetical protein [Gryllotalpicola kribbensis]
MVRPTRCGAYAVTGPRAQSDVPEEASYGAAVRVALARLARASRH